MKTLLLTFSLLICNVIFAQVGIGTTNPTAQLEINTSGTSLPALEISPQSSPIGTATGQLAVIDDKLFLYDQTRGKWLSVESCLLNFGLEEDSDNVFLEYVGDIQRSGPKMPLDGTLVYVTMNSSGGQSDKEVQIFKNGVAIIDTVDANKNGNLSLEDNVFTSTTHNIDFNEGDEFNIEVSGDGSAVRDLSVLLWVKWRN